MGARIFISYRSSDGTDKATALARDLGREFGTDAVFLDKDDLRGGAAWRAEIGRTLQARPVLLLLLTHDLLEARAADGTLRIAQADDPVRRELDTAMAAGAEVIPVLCDGLAAPPDATRLPSPFHHIGELTWRRLRALDWTADVARLVSDLRALGVEPADSPAAPPAAADAAQRATAAPSRRRAVGWMSSVLAAGTAAGAWWWFARSRGGIDGRWLATLNRGERVTLDLHRMGSVVRLISEPVPITERADWAEYRAFWRNRFGTELEAIVYRGEGVWRADPGASPAIDVGLKVHPAGREGPDIDGGNLSATLAADGRTMAGTLWLNSLQREQPAALKRI